MAVGAAFAAVDRCVRAVRWRSRRADERATSCESASSRTRPGQTPSRSTDRAKKAHARDARHDIRHAQNAPGLAVHEASVSEGARRGAMCFTGSRPTLASTALRPAPALLRWSGPASSAIKPARIGIAEQRANPARRCARHEPNRAKARPTATECASTRPAIGEIRHHHDHAGEQQPIMTRTARGRYSAPTGIRCQACVRPPAAANVAKPSMAKCEWPITQSEKWTVWFTAICACTEPWMLTTR